MEEEEEEEVEEEEEEGEEEEEEEEEGKSRVPIYRNKNMCTVYLQRFKENIYIHIEKRSLFRHQLMKLGNEAVAIFIQYRSHVSIVIAFE